MELRFITKSYRRDFERCQLLCESTEAFLPDGAKHVLVIDRSDMAQFRPLQRGRVEVVCSDEFLPRWMKEIPGFPGVRFNAFGLPLRGWLTQQILKIAAAVAMDADIAVFLDSDVVLTRALPPDRFVNAGRTRLQRTSFDSPQHRKWSQVARRLFGIAEGGAGSANYVGHLVTWARRNVVLMTERMEVVSGRSWIGALAREMTFSEYMLYGIFVDDVVGAEAARQFHDDKVNIVEFWDEAFDGQDGLEAFLRSVPPDALGVMIHSKLDVPVAHYRAQIERLWTR